MQSKVQYTREIKLMVDRVGQSLGNYRLTRLLGQGGFADVYLGEHIYLKRLAAIKILNTRLTKDDFEHFYKEAQFIAYLQHSHILQILDFGVEDSNPYLVMEYAPNGTLRHRHPRGSIVPLPTIINYIEQVASALQYVHNQKLIHRDIKPENMLLSSQDNVLLSDFGIATVAHTSISLNTQETTGTIPYMAPEQLQGRPRPASDQYALGIVVYEWLSGERPFQGSFVEIATQHLMIPPPSLHSKSSGISSEVESVVFTALAKDPQQRFPSVQEFATALERAYISSGQYREDATVADLSTIPLLDQKIKPTAHPSFPPSASPTSFDREEFLNTYQPVDHEPTLLLPFEKEKPPQSVKQDTSLSVGPSALVDQNSYIPPPATYAISPYPEVTRSQIERLPTIIAKTKENLPPGTTRATWLGHKGDVVYGVAWSPNGKHIASAGADKKVQVWDAKATRTSFVCQHKDKVYAVAWSPDGNFLASASADSTGQVWNAVTKRKLFEYDAHSPLHAVAWSPDGTSIAWAGADRSVSVWNAQTKSKIVTYRNHFDWVLAVAWSPDGSAIASAGNDMTVHVWTVATGKTIYIYREHSDWVRAVAWSPDGSAIASASNDKSVRIWQAKSGYSLLTYRGHADALCGAVLTLACSPNGEFMASAGEDQTVHIWDIPSGKVLYKYQKHSAPISSISWSPDGRQIASASYDGAVQVWQAVESANEAIVKSVF